jgi:hypothetical protein
MTPTTTKTRAPSTEDGLKEREQKWSDARADADTLAREHSMKLRQARALADERRRLVNRQPELVDHLQAPLGPDNPAGEIDRQIAALGDLEDLWRRVEHARQIERSAKQSWGDFVASHFWELIGASREEADAVAADANEAARAFADKLNRYLEFHSRIAGFTHPVPGIDTRIVPGLQEAVDLRRVAESADLKPPIPEEN